MNFLFAIETSRDRESPWKTAIPVQLQYSTTVHHFIVQYIVSQELVRLNDWITLELFLFLDFISGDLFLRFDLYEPTNRKLFVVLQ